MRETLAYLLILQIGFSPAVLWADPSLKELELPATIVTDSPYFTLDPKAEKAEEEGFLKFHLEAQHASYAVEGIAPLQKLLREVEVIEKIRRDEESSGFMDGVSGSIESTKDGFVSLVTRPKDSVKGMGKAAGVLGRKMGGVFRKKEEGEKASFSEKLLGGSERELAKQFGVDVYTSNPYMRETLTQMAKARLGGKGAAAITKFLLPVAGIISVTLTASGINAMADQLINSKSRGDLFYLNKEALLALQFSPAEVNVLLNLPYYSPRETTYMRFYLEELKAVNGHREILKKAIESKSLREARGILYAAQMAADGMPEGAPYERLNCFAEGFAAADSNKVIFITPYDYLDPSALGDRVLNRALGLKKEWQKSSVEIWNAGKISTGFSTAAFLKGIKTRSWVLFQ